MLYEPIRKWILCTARSGCDLISFWPLGKAQTAAVKRDAEIGVAQANRDAGIREAECEKAAMDVKYNTDTKIEDNSRAFKLQKANFDKEVNTAVSFCFISSHIDIDSIRKRGDGGRGWGC